MSLIIKMKGKGTILLFLVAVLLPFRSTVAQEWHFGIMATPAISWFKTDISEVRNSGARAGFILNAFLEKNLKDNWYFSGGLAFMNTGARLKYTEPTYFRFPGYTSIIGAGKTIVYNMQYLSAPVEIKIKTPPSGNLVYYGGFGLDPKVVIRGTADIPSIDIEGENARDEIERFNVGYHFTGGLEYETRGSISFILGLAYESNIFDTTKDNDGQVIDRAVQKLIRFIFGIKF
ncbi:MAG TPA: porin family protein [Bacteroidales bacterium]|jgi:hypothetical protein|nr:porin family protein [Bacteroidales bacterium]